MSWKAEVKADSTDTWRGNGLRFERESEAIFYACNLADRWSGVREWRTVESSDPVTHAWIDEKAVLL